MKKKEATKPKAEDLICNLTLRVEIFAAAGEKSTLLGWLWFDPNPSIDSPVGFFISCFLSLFFLTCQIDFHHSKEVRTSSFCKYFHSLE